MFSINIRIIAVGKLKEDFYRKGEDHYLERLKPYARVEVIELSESAENKKDGSNADKKRALAQEGDKVNKKLRPEAHKVVLAAQGTSKTTPEFASYLENLQVKGQSKVDFIIGGPLGITDEILKNSDLSLSLSCLTFPHRLARIILLEQLYRCFKIIKGEPYHK